MPRPSKVDRLPPELRAQLERLLLDKTHGGYHALADWLRAQGYEISHASVHRHDQRLHAVMGRMRAAAEAAVLINRAAPDEADEQSAATIRMVQAALFDAMTAVAGAEDADPAERVKLLSPAARAVAEASRASIGNKKWQQEVRERLEAVEKAAEKTGKRLDAATLKAVREALYGG